MKQFYASVWLTLLCATASAQWSTDPANPLVVCDAPGAQTSMTAVHDGHGGYFVFWRDGRMGNSKYFLYGQRYDSLGAAQWEANGRPVVTDTARTVSGFNAVSLGNGNFILAYSSGLNTSGTTDTIRAMKYDGNATPQWDSAALIGGDDASVLYVGAMELIEKDGGAYIAFALTYIGGGVAQSVNRVDADGNVLWNYNGTAVPNSGYGPFNIAQDGAGGVFFYWRTGNGAGDPLRVQRVDEDGNMLWPTAVDPTAGTPGLGYDFRGTYDNNHGLILTWVKNGNDLLMARVDTAGALTWTPAVKTVCDYSSNQDIPRIAMLQNQFYVAWVDNRPPAANADVYMQRFDMNGDPQWNPIGVRASSVNTYIPYPEVVPSDSGSVIFTIERSGTDAFRANRMRMDSSIAWPNNGAQLATQTLNPFYQEYKLLTAADSGAVVFWKTQNENIYGARVRYTGELFNAIETVNANNIVTTYPNPSDNVINFKLKHDERVRFLRVLSIDGRTQNVSLSESKKSADVEHLASGVYVLEIETENGLVRGKFVKH